MSDETEIEKEVIKCIDCGEEVTDGSHCIECGAPCCQGCQQDGKCYECYLAEEDGLPDEAN